MSERVSRETILSHDLARVRAMPPDEVRSEIDRMRGSLGDQFVYMAILAWSIDPLAHPGSELTPASDDRSEHQRRAEEHDDWSTGRGPSPRDDDDDDDEHDPLGWHVLPGTVLLEALRRVERGEKADLVFAEHWANAETEDV